MIFPAPTAQEERNAVLHDRVRKLRKRGVIGEEAAAQLLALWPSTWKRHGLLLATVFFFMTAIALVAFNGIAELFGVRGPMVLVLSLVLAEMLIRKRRMFRTGIEAALVSGGFVSFILWLPSEGKPEALLVFALAAAITSWRVHSAIFGTIAVLLAYAYIPVKSGPGITLALLSGAAIVIVAAAALTRRIERPWIEQLSSYTLVSIVPAMYVAARIAFWRTWPVTWLAVLFAAMALALIAAGLAVRHHAHLVAGLLACAAALVESWDALQAAPEAKLMTLGGALLAGSILAGRMLRNRTSGLVATPLQLTPVDSALQMAAAAVASATVDHPEPPAADPAPVGGGGSMGGAGATGEWQ